MPKRCPKGQDSRGVISNLGGDWGKCEVSQGEGGEDLKNPKREGGLYVVFQVRERGS